MEPSLHAANPFSLSADYISVMPEIGTAVKARILMKWLIFNLKILKSFLIKSVKKNL